MMRINDGEEEVEVKKQAGSLDASADGFVPRGFTGVYRVVCDKSLTDAVNERR